MTRIRATAWVLAVCLGYANQIEAKADQISAQPTAAAPAATSSAGPPGQAETAGTAKPAAPSPARVPPKIPTASFAAWPEFRDPELSPDGYRFLARATLQGKEVVTVIDLRDHNKATLLRVPKDFDLVWYRWAGNGTVLISIGKAVPWGDDQAYSTRLYAFDTVQQKSQFVGGNQEGLVGDDVLWIDPDGQKMLLSYQRTIYDWPSVFSVDIATNKAEQVVPQRSDIWSWSADNDGIVRYGWGYTDDHHWKAVYRKSPDEKFKVIAKNRDDREESSNFDILRIIQGSDEGFVYDTDEHTGLKAIYKFNFATRVRGDLVFSAPASDIDEAYTSEDGKTMQSAWYTDDKPRVHWWDEQMQHFQQDLDKAVNKDVPDDRIARVISQSRDKAIKLVWVGAANDPGNVYVFQEATGRMQRLLVMRRELKPEDLAMPHYVHYKSRDGLDIPAYLTLPVGREPKGLPLVILPHGGPFWVRDEGGYDDDVQFLANRGYAVLQPEFRGSGSYGTKYFDAGKGQWGRAMQDDIDDGMDWLAKQGTIDAKRVCIVGISYGGYAALWGATRNPERYRCAASLAGVTDVGRQLKYSNHFDDNKRSREDWKKTVQGDSDFDLKTISPLYAVDRLKVPVLILHGEDDTRVLPLQSKLYANALKAAGKTFEYYTLPDNGHGYTTVEGAKSWYDYLDAFLAKYNPGD